MHHSTIHLDGDSSYDPYRDVRASSPRQPLSHPTVGEGVAGGEGAREGGVVPLATAHSVSFEPEAVKSGKVGSFGAELECKYVQTEAYSPVVSFTVMNSRTGHKEDVTALLDTGSSGLVATKSVARRLYSLVE